MTPIQPAHEEPSCRPRWVHLNPLLSYCTRTIVENDASGEDAGAAAPCRHKDCLFSASRSRFAA